MPSWLETIALGIIQGITEFLPISSDGHLALFQILTRSSPANGSTGGVDSIFFDVMLHVGTALAIVWCYRAEVRAGLRGLLGAKGVEDSFRRESLLRLGGLVFVSLLPLVPVALFFKNALEQTFQSLTAVGLGFLFTAIVLIWTTRVRGGHKTLATMTWSDALLIGLAQALSPLPGVSRSGLTIAMALMRGFSKSWAVGFSLLLAVPTILAAAAFELRKAGGAGLSGEEIARILCGAALAGVVGYGAIVWLVRIVRSDRLWYFSVYLIVLSGIVLGVLAPRMGGTDATKARTGTVDIGERVGSDRDAAPRREPFGNVGDALARSSAAPARPPGVADPRLPPNRENTPRSHVGRPVERRRASG